MRRRKFYRIAVSSK